MSVSASTTFLPGEIPFSREGSWLNISPVVGTHEYADDLHLVSHQTGLHAVLRLVPIGHGAVSVTATASMLSWVSPVGRIDAAFEDTDTVRLRGHGLGLRIGAAGDALTPFTGQYLFQDPRDGAYVFTVYETGRRYRLTVLIGDATSAGVEAVGVCERHLELSGAGTWEVAIEELDTARPTYRPTGTFEDVVQDVDRAFGDYVDAVAPWRDGTTPAAALAAYVIWSATVRPLGFLARPSVLMSKHWMDKVWSWDHCFNAIAVSGGRPDLAIDQFLVMFDHQDESGALPDSVTHSEVLHNYVKPPIHGWAFERLRAVVPSAVLVPQLADIYSRLSRWTEFWLDSRRVPGHALPHYQHGNDSGWDNATTFDAHRVIESPDLAAFLVIQLDALARLAAELGDVAGEQRWLDVAASTRSALLEELWREDRFVTRAAASGEVGHTDSLLELMPVVLGADLPEHVRDALTRRLRRHLTRWGLATEVVDSPHYEPDGYWRGPIWAPSTVLIEDGVRRAGDDALADEISSRFRALCEASGFAENFDALTGAGLRDRAYTWTAAGYLILAGAAARRATTDTDRTAAELIAEGAS